MALPTPKGIVAQINNIPTKLHLERIVCIPNAAWQCSTQISELQIVRMLYGFFCTYMAYIGLHVFSRCSFRHIRCRLVCTTQQGSLFMGVLYLSTWVSRQKLNMACIRGHVYFLNVIAVYQI